MSRIDSKAERLLLVVTPAVAMAAVALGLRIGAPEGLRAAIVYAAPSAAGGTGLAWQIVVFDEDHGAREPAAGVALDVVAHTESASASWHGVTDPDGVAEAQLHLPVRTPPGAHGHIALDVRSGGTVLAAGIAAPPPLASAARREPGWLRFARRDGTIALDVALLGQRAAPGFPAELWVRATDATSSAPLGHVAISLESDPSVALTGPAIALTDTRGWTRALVTPVGLAVTATFEAHASGGRDGTWIGGLFMSPGGPSVDTRSRWDPGAPVTLEVAMPTVRPTAYTEIDDSEGRAWASAVPLESRADGTSHARVVAEGLAPGLYWAVASANGGGAAVENATSDMNGWAPGSTARPFFVAPSDEAALRFGTERVACEPPADPRETSNGLSACLALTAPAPAPRWTALDGFLTRRASDRDARAKGLAVALGAIANAILLEGTLLVRAARGTTPGRLRTVAMAVLVGLLGFALLAAFIVRV